MTAIPSRPTGSALTMNLVFNGLLFVTMQYLQDVLHYSPPAAGCAVLPLAVPLVVLAPVSWPPPSGQAHSR